MEGLFPDPHARIPKEKRVRRKPMQVLCLGVSRTATMSTYAGLKNLGYTPYHAAEMGLDAANDSLQYWTEATNAKFRGKGVPYQGKDFDKILWRYDAVTDIPSCLFADELLDACPNAKVILTARDVDSWVESVKATFYPILSWWGWVPLRILDRSFTYLYIPLLLLPLQIWSRTPTTLPPTFTTASSLLPDPELLRVGFHSHYTHIRKVVPPSNLLEWHPQDGWETLCRFLGKEVPKEYRVEGRKEVLPFPKINEPRDTLGILGMVYKYRWIVVGVKLGRWVTAGVVGWAGWRLWNAMV